MNYIQKKVKIGKNPQIASSLLINSVALNKYYNLFV